MVFAGIYSIRFRSFLRGQPDIRWFYFMIYGMICQSCTDFCLSAECLDIFFVP